jgi:hypothetical protein
MIAPDLHAPVWIDRPDEPTIIFLYPLPVLDWDGLSVQVYHHGDQSLEMG